MKKEKKTPSLPRRCFRETLRAHPALSLALGLSIPAAAALSLIPPQILRLTVDRCLVPADTQGLGTLAAAYLAALLALFGMEFLKNLLLTLFGQDLLAQLRGAMYRKMTRLRGRYFSDHSAGEITARLMNDCDSVGALFADGVIAMAADCLKIIGIVISIALFSRPLGLLTLVLLPAVLALTRVFQKRTLAAQGENLRQMGGLNGQMEENLRLRRMIRAFCKEDYFADRYDRLLLKNFSTRQKVNFCDSVYAPIIQLLRAAAIAAVCLLSCPAAGLNGLSVGMVAASAELLTSLFAPIESLGMEITNIQKGISGLTRTADFGREEEAPPPTEHAAQAPAEVVLTGVCFGYTPQQPVFQNLTLTIPAGQRVVFAGRTGVGKSTLFGLILGLLQPQRGAVTLAGTAAGALPQNERRTTIGFVPQRFSPVPGTVEEQITLGDRHLSRAAVKEVAALVGLDEEISALPQDYDTPFAAAALSHGQQQLLSIARAIVSRPQILLLDEVTADLDAATEARISAALARVLPGRTVLSVTHRAAAMRAGERLIVLENGGVVADGAPAQILADFPALTQREALESAGWRTGM